MIAINAKDKKIKIGLEIHLQLSTGKLFCKCPDMNNSGIKGKFSRKLFPTENESGDVDVAALQEERKNVIYEYEVSDNSCLVEADEEPPHEINVDALDTALQIAFSFNSEVLNAVSVMRKVVVDGSNTSGFQRTAVASTGGYVTINEKKVGLTTICIEEDSARRVESGNDHTVFSLDRLGIPLVEISTAPDIETFQEAVDVAREIGMRAMLTGNIRRDSDAIRQDVNFSMGYGRVEIKGISKLSLISEALIAEENRQKFLSEAIGIFLERGGFDGTVLIDYTEKIAKSESKIIQKGIAAGNRIFAGKLENLGGILKSGNYRIGKELADALKLFSIGGFIHSDELPGYGITQDEVNEIKKFLKSRENDAIILISIPESKKDIAQDAINKRVEKLSSLDFSETRAANEDGTSRFLRPISGSGRMYPETDIPTIKIKNSRMVELNSAAPKSFDQALSSFTDEWEISRQEAEIILATGRKKEFIELAKLWGKPREMSRMILQSIPEIERKYRKKLEYSDLKTLVEKIATKNYGRISLEMAIDQCISGKSIEKVVISDDIRPLDRNELKIIVERIRKSGDIRKENIIAKVKNETNRPVDPKIVMEIYQNS